MVLALGPPVLAWCYFFALSLQPESDDLVQYRHPMSGLVIEHYGGSRSDWAAPDFSGGSLPTLHLTKTAHPQSNSGINENATAAAKRASRIISTKYPSIPLRLAAHSGHILSKVVGVMPLPLRGV
jgi:hypothetical protein